MHKEFKELGYIMQKTMANEEPTRILVVRDALDRIEYDTDHFPRYCEVLYRVYQKVSQKRNFTGCMKSVGDKVYDLYVGHGKELEILESMQTHRIIRLIY